MTRRADVAATLTGAVIGGVLSLFGIVVVLTVVFA